MIAQFRKRGRRKLRVVETSVGTVDMTNATPMVLGSSRAPFVQRTFERVAVPWYCAVGGLAGGPTRSPEE